MNTRMTPILSRGLFTLSRRKAFGSRKKGPMLTFSATYVDLRLSVTHSSGPGGTLGLALSSGSKGQTLVSLPDRTTDPDTLTNALLTSSKAIEELLEFFQTCLQRHMTVLSNAALISQQNSSLTSSREAASQEIVSLIPAVGQSRSSMQRVSLSLQQLVSKSTREPSEKPQGDYEKGAIQAALAVEKALRQPKEQSE